MHPVELADSGNRYLQAKVIAGGFGAVSDFSRRLGMGFSAGRCQSHFWRAAAGQPGTHYQQLLLMQKSSVRAADIR
jgi:hypothetical protein